MRRSDISCTADRDTVDAAYCVNTQHAEYALHRYLRHPTLEIAQVIFTRA